MPLFVVALSHWFVPGARITPARAFGFVCGFVGATLVICLFGVVVFKAISLGPRAAAVGLPYQGLVSSGIGLMLGLQAFINIGVNMGLLPTKGLTLPLISYGRTSAVITVVALALIMRAHHEVKEGERRASAKSGKGRSG